MATKLTHRIRYTGGLVLIRTKRGTIEISHRQADPADNCRYVPVLNNEQRARIEALGARNRTDYYALPIEHAETVLAIATDAWGQPIDTDGYDMPTAQQPATEDEPEAPTAPETATEDDPTQAAARIIHEHGNTLYAALHSHIKAQSRSGLDPTQVAQDNEEMYALADRILDVMEALPSPERWTIESVTEYIGAASTNSARKTLSRWGVKPVGREPGRGGQSLYDPAQVRAAKAARPGRWPSTA